MTVQLMLTCLSDSLYGEVGIATVKVLEYCGYEVRFPEAQSCCGQPLLNSGQTGPARTVAAHALSCFDPAIPVVVPSASCTAMAHSGWARLLPDSDRPRVFELCNFLLDVAGVYTWPGLPVGRSVGLHRSCHSRELADPHALEKVVGLVPNIVVTSFDEDEQCCGFGGVFAVSHKTLSARIGSTKLSMLGGAGVNHLVSADMSCLMHLEALARAQGQEIRCQHVAELLAEAL